MQKPWVFLLLSFLPLDSGLAQTNSGVFCNGQAMEVAGDQVFANGQRREIAGDLFYPTGERVVIGGTCHFQTGVPMSECPEKIYFEDNSQAVTTSGLMDLKSGQNTDQSFEFREFPVIVRWKMNSEGLMTDLQTHCYKSLF